MSETPDSPGGLGRRKFLRYSLLTGAGIAVASVATEALARPALAITQTDWRWCFKCQGLFYNPHASTSNCPAGSTHSGAESLSYTITDNPPFAGQADWRWCFKCEGLFYNPHASTSNCPAGSTHSGAESASYVIALTPSRPAPSGWQDLWAWCAKCEGLFYSQGDHLAASVCPSGGTHAITTSFDYMLKIT